MRTCFHVGISILVRSVKFRLTVYVHSGAFNHIQCSLKGIHAHSEHIHTRSSAFNTCSKMFSHTQSGFMHVQFWSMVVTLTKRHLVSQATKGPMDMCLNRQSMRKPYVNGHNVCWMFFNIPWLDIICQKTNDIKLNHWEGENEIGNQNNIDLT